MPTIPRNKLRPRLTKDHPLYKKKNQDKKRRLVIKNLYNLPLTVKVKIFKMAVASNMITWEEENKVHFYDSLEFINSGHGEDPYITYGEGKILNPPCAAPPRGIEKNGEWYPDHYWSYGDGGTEELNPQVPIFTPITLCRKAKSLGYSAESQIRHVKLPSWSPTPSVIREREGHFTRFVDSLGTPHIPPSEYNIFWFHKKCRCFLCDKVRYTAYKKLSSDLHEDDKKKVEGKFWEIGRLNKEDSRGIYRWCSMDYVHATHFCKVSIPVYWQYIVKWDEEDGCPPSEERKEWEIANRYK
jgi:hypothetical protein